MYRINFYKNLQRFQEIAHANAQKEPKLAELANIFAAETLLPSTWTLINNALKSQKGELNRGLKSPGDTGSPNRRASPNNSISDTST